jgi:translation initiation factor 2B subunit (eIF-2B alpha/beta/delta family)/ADP-ribose pyrophosphatase YjhB (NUDIX family)
LNYRQVVTSFLTADQRILLLRRSDKVGSYRGKWSAVSGYLEGPEEPLTRAVTEIREELGLSSEQIHLVRVGGTVRAFDEGIDTVWIIHPFLFEAMSKAIKLDWENTDYRWVDPAELASYETVPKLREALDRVRYDLQAEPASLVGIIRKVKELAEDRIHGATFLGRQAVVLLSEAAQASDAGDGDALFHDLLLVASQLRRAQPAMANVWNLTGKLLHRVDQQRMSGMPIEELKSLVQRLSAQVLEEVREDSENVARNTAQVLPQDGFVLTHSYSNTVLRSLELGFKGGRRFKVYATESSPGMEGKQLTKELIELGVPATLIADSAVNSIIQNVSLVLVGADSVLRDGSLVHKVGTRHIGVAAARRGIPLYSACETVKFSTQDFLGERLEAPTALFDVTSAEFVTGYITEDGPLATGRVEWRIRNLQKEVYW